MSGKLTKAQRELLAELPTSCADQYAPAKKLVAMGLAVWNRGAFGDRLLATDEGRCALSRTEGTAP